MNVLTILKTISVLHKYDCVKQMTKLTFNTVHSYPRLGDLTVAMTVAIFFGNQDVRFSGISHFAIHPKEVPF